MTKNPIKFIRNPNSPEAIQARLDGYADTTPFEAVTLITDPTASHIFVDLTETKTDQLVNYPLVGGHKEHLNKKLIRTSLHTDSQGRAILTNYYTDVRNLQWVIIKSFLNKDLPSPPSHSSSHPAPRPTFSNTFGFFSSAPGETWVNQGKSIDRLHAAQRRIANSTKIDPQADETKEVPLDHFTDDFTGER